MAPNSEYFIDGIKVEEGARFYQATNLDKGPRFRVEAVCDSDAGDVWHGEVKLEGHVIIRTDSVASKPAASDLAEKLLRQRLLEVFGS